MKITVSWRVRLNFNARIFPTQIHDNKKGSQTNFYTTNIYNKHKVHRLRSYSLFLVVVLFLPCNLPPAAVGPSDSRRSGGDIFQEFGRSDSSL